MDLYLVQLSKVTAKALMPSASPSSFNNAAREEAIPTIIPEISLRPKGGYWFIVIAPNLNETLHFIAWGKAERVILSSTKKKEENKMILDLTKYNQEVKKKEGVMHLGMFKIKKKEEVELEEYEQESIDKIEEDMRLFQEEVNNRNKKQE